MKNKYIFFIPLFALIASSCEEVIELDFNDSNTRVVIEANLTDQPNGSVVKISETIDFDQPNVFPTIDNAVVTITDDDGDVFNLTNTGSGSYQNSDLIGEYNKTYFLKVVVNSKTYEASSTMPNPVNVDSLAITEIAFFGASTKFLDVFLQDPVEEENYYKFIPYVNSEKYFNIEVLDDQFTNGQPVDYGIFFQDYELQVGDSVGLEVWHTDKKIYDYFDSLADIIDGGSQSAAPANPNTNLSNGALGYFSAHAVLTYGIVVE
jgi:hypothetical protein